MKIKSKQLLSTLLAVMMVFGLFAVMPLTAMAVNTDVAILSSDSADSVKTKIHNAINASNSGDTVTVTGSISGVITTQIGISIPTGVKVVWKATCIGSTYGQVPLFYLHNSEGTFEIAEGGIIGQTGTAYALYIENVDVIINGGTVSSSSADRPAICSHNNNIELLSGKVENTGNGNAIEIVSNASFTMSGGTVSAAGGIAISSGANSSVTVSGGWITGYGHKTVIDALDTDTTVTITGGLVCGYGTEVLGVNNVINVSSGTPTIGGSAVVCAWNKAAGHTEYTAGTSNDLAVNPSTASVEWVKVSSYHGIHYANGSNTGFLSIDDVTVTAATGAALTPTTVNYVKNSGNDVVLTVDLAGYTPQSIKNGSYTLQAGTDFIINNSTTVTLKAAYLNTLAVGAHTLTFTFSGGTSPTLNVNVTGTGVTLTPTAVTFNMNDGGDIHITVDLAGYTPQSIKNGSYTLQAGT